MAVAALAPVLLKLTGLIYGITALVSTGIFALLAFQVYRSRETDIARMKPERRLFSFSILYLFIIFGAAVVDRWVFA
jgi:protoheme IX farnesyltransferase